MSVHGTPGRNRLRALLASGEVAVGLSCALGSAQVVEEFARSGADFVYVDQQHGHVSADTLRECLRAFEGTTATPLVRVAQNDHALVAHALDGGAHGVIVPQVDTVDDARRAVDACRYPPAGTRSWGPIRAHHGLGADPLVVNTEVICLVMIESVTALGNLEAILAVPGVDGVYVGPADLSVSLGGPPLSAEQSTDPDHQAALDRIRVACSDAGLVCGISGAAAPMAARGFTLITVGSDTAAVRALTDRVPAHREDASAHRADTHQQQEEMSR